VAFVALLAAACRRPNPSYVEPPASRDAHEDAAAPGARADARPPVASRDDAPSAAATPDGRSSADMSAAAPPDRAGPAPDRAPAPGEAGPASDAAAAPRDAAAADGPTAPDAPGAPTDAGAGGPALFVVGTLPLIDADRQLRDRLAAVGYTVTARLDSMVTAEQAAAAALVVISGSIASTRLAGRLRDVRTPVVCFEAGLFDDLGMTGPEPMVDYWGEEGQDRVTIVSPSHPLAAGLSGTVAVFTQRGMMSWGAPAPAAARVATHVGQPGRIAVYGYPAGAMMYRMPAPAARVGLFASGGATTAYSQDGLALFQAAVRWAVEGR
jgi:hypothetical protein